MPRRRLVSRFGVALVRILSNLPSIGSVGVSSHRWRKVRSTICAAAEGAAVPGRLTAFSLPRAVSA
jgi:hypothetical protein